MKGTRILITSKPRGVFIDGYIHGTPKPGTVMQLKAATNPVANVFTWKVFDADADGNQRIVAVLLEKDQEGKTCDDAYVSGDMGRVYCPVMGEELNMRVADVAGTGTSGTEAKAIGDLMMVEDGTGLLIDTSGTPESEPFVLLEPQLEPIGAEALLRCMYTGY